MSIKSSSKAEFQTVYLYQRETEISCLNEKIHSIMRNIDLTRKTLNSVANRLYTFAPGLMSDKQNVGTYVLSLIGYLKYIFTGSIFTMSISILVTQKCFYELVNKSQHRELNRLEKILQETEKEVDEFRQSQNLTFTPYHQALIKANEPDVEEKLFVDDFQHGITLRKFLPIGWGADPAFILMQKKADKLFERAMSSTVIKELYIEAMLTKDPFTGETGVPWSLFFPSEEDMAPEVKEFGASCHPRHRMITIDPSQTDDEALSCFVFELTNAISTDRHAKFLFDILDGKIGREAFAKEKERIEYEGALRHDEIMIAADKEIGPIFCLPMAPSIIPFELEWHFYIKKSSHADLYRKAWDSLQRAVQDPTILTEIERNHLQSRVSECAKAPLLD